MCKTFSMLFSFFFSAQYRTFPCNFSITILTKPLEAKQHPPPKVTLRVNLRSNYAPSPVTLTVFTYVLTTKIRAWAGRARRPARNPGRAEARVGPSRPVHNTLEACIRPEFWGRPSPTPGPARPGPLWANLQVGPARPGGPTENPLENPGPLMHIFNI